MLEVRNIKKNYGEIAVLKDIDFSISKGEIVSLVGSSGAGKTTLLQILGTLDKPDHGEVLINGQNPFLLSEKKLAHFRNNNIGFIFQFHQLLPEFTALENAMMPALIRGDKPEDAKKRVQKLFEMLHLSHRLEHKPNQLSGGEQQRVSVIRSLVNEPKIIFADEPSGNLDSVNSVELHKLFFELRDEFQQTFVLVTHNEELANMADRKMTIKDGKIHSFK